MPIRIITDSASDMVSPQRQEVRVLPMTISFEGRQYQDGIDLEPVSTTCNHRLSGLFVVQSDCFCKKALIFFHVSGIIRIV